MRRTLEAFLTIATCALATFAATATARAQAWPTRTITIVVPLAPGAGMDTITRWYGEELSKALGKPVVVENQPGAALMLAAQNVAKAEPDGHTLLVSATTVMTATASLTRKFNFDPDRDFTPISIYLDSPFVLIASPSLGVTSLKEFIALARTRTAKPPTFGTTGTGSLLHLVMEALKQELSFPADHVPYRNTGQIVTDVVAGHLSASMSETAAPLPLINDGKIKALGISSLTRHPQLPNVPTLAEAAERPGFEGVAWHTLVAPSATPKPIVDRLVAEMERISAGEEFRKRVLGIGLVPRKPMSAPQMTAYIRAERERWNGLVKRLGLEGTP
jgi:tripartite-type tricarboxylate transporter receptor subunit TctC